MFGVQYLICSSVQYLICSIDNSIGHFRINWPEMLIALRKTNEHTIKTLYDKITSGLVVVGYGAARLVTS